MITGPVTASTTELVNKITGGVALPSGAATVSLQSQCLTDTFQGRISLKHYIAYVVHNVKLINFYYSNFHYIQIH